MYELRELSGSHRGESLPPCAVDLKPGDLVRVGDVWMTLTASGAAQAQAKPERVARHHRLERKNLFIQLAAAVVICAAACVSLFTSQLAVGETAAVEEPVAEVAALTPEQLRQAFRSRLADADLTSRFKLTLSDSAWLMHAVLDDTETPRFERVLWDFLREHKLSFPVSAKIVSADTMLPFKIQQVVSGANASLVTQDGRRLRVGEQYRGVRLLAIKGNRLRFGGKRKFELKW